MTTKLARISFRFFAHICLILLGFSGSINATPLPQPIHSWLTVPQEFEVVPVTHPAVRIAARHRSNGFPTINIIAESGPFSPPIRGEATRKNDLLASYAAVGLSNSTITGTWTASVGATRTPGYGFTVDYTSGGVEYEASVVFIERADLRVTITYIDTARAAASHYALRDRLLTQVSLPVAPLSHPATTNPDQMTTLALALLGICTVAYMIILSRRRTR